MPGPTVLVTGADGFIGSHLSEMLVERGAAVRALCHYNSFNSWGWLDESPVRGEMEIMSGDVRDPHLCDAIMHGVDTVYHLAALIAIPYSYAAPDSYLETNVRGTLNICQAARRHRVRRLVQTSTSEVYGTARYVPIDEAHPLQAQSPYAASKMAADHIAMSFHAAFDLPVTIARPFNTYGPRQSLRAVIPTIISQIAAGRREVSIGDLTPTRDFTYVRDTCRGIVALGAAERTVGEVVNIGSNTEVSIGDTLELIKALMNAGTPVVTDSRRLRPPRSEVFRLRCDNTKIRTLTGFEPQVTLRDGLAKTIEWFRERRRFDAEKSGVYNV